jgi:predicted metal-binding transcription factor (methanogenesis marker protein 9)
MSKKTPPVTEEGNEKEMSPEQLTEMRKKMIKYFVDQNQVLSVQSEFEKHQADITENRARAMKYQIMMGQMMQAPDAPKEERKLKKTDA